MEAKVNGDFQLDAQCSLPRVGVNVGSVELVNHKPNTQLFSMKVVSQARIRCGVTNACS